MHPKIEERIRALEELGHLRGPVDRPPGGGDDGGMEARVAKLEATIQHIQSDVKELQEEARGIRGDMRVDFRILFGATIVSTLGVAGLIAKGFHWI